MPVVHFPFSDQKIEVVRRGIGRSGQLEIALSVEFHFGNRDAFVRRQLFVLRRSKMGKRQDQTDDQAISRDKSVSHRSTKAKTGRQQAAVDSLPPSPRLWRAKEALKMQKFAMARPPSPAREPRALPSRWPATHKIILQLYIDVIPYFATVKNR
jgi:hypothetical protein